MTFNKLKRLLMSALCVGCLALSVQTAQATEYNTVPYFPYPYSDSYALNENGEAMLTWNDDAYHSGSQVSYELEFAKSEDFSDAVIYTSTECSLTLTKDAFGKNGGKFYVRVRCIENGSAYSDWSDTAEIIYVKINKTNFPGMYKLLKKGGVQNMFIYGQIIYDKYDKNEDEWLDPCEIWNVRGLFTDYVETTKNGKKVNELSSQVSSLEGIEYLTNLECITLKQYSGKKMDFSENKQLREIQLYGISANQLTVIAPSAKRISIAPSDFASLKKVDVSKCTNLVDAYVSGANKTKTLKLPKSCTSLKSLQLKSFSIDEVNLNRYPNLEEFYIYNSKTNNIKLNKCVKLKYLYLGQCESIKKLDVSKNKDLIGLSVYQTPSLSKKALKGYKNAQKATINTKDAMWWKNTEAYQKLQNELMKEVSRIENTTY